MVLLLKIFFDVRAFSLHQVFDQVNKKSYIIFAGSPPPTDSNFKPSFLSDQELKHLVLEAADGFLFVVSCKTAKIMYVSDSVTPVLNHAQADLIDQSLYTLIHPEDVDKAKDQLAVEETSETRVLDIKSKFMKNMCLHKNRCPLPGVFVSLNPFSTKDKLTRFGP